MAGQGVRAAGYGFTAVLLGALLAARGFSSVQAGVVLTATTLEQAMLAAEDAGTAAVYGRYNAVGSAAGALGSLAVILPGLNPQGPSGGVSGWLFLAMVPVGITGIVLAAGLSPAVEAPAAAASPLEPAARVRSQLGPSRAVVRRLAGLFAVDAAGGGLVTTGARRFGLVATMVGTHLPSNLLLASVAFAPGFGVAAGLLLARTTLSQMDVPARQALVMTVVTAPERTAGAAVTNAARYSVRPIGPLAAGLVQQVALGAPLVVAGAVKAGYDVTLWLWARRLGLASGIGTHQPGTAAGAVPAASSGEPS